MKMRKISVIGADEPVKDIMSRRSVIGTMDKFVQAVDSMNEIVMVPSLLMDVSMDQNNSSDMHSFYSLLNTVRQQLLFGSTNSQNANKEPTFVELGKRPSLRRMSSVSSTSTDYSDYSSESEVSGLESGDESNCSRLTSDFQYHLMGLCKSLKQLTQSANVLTTKYKEEVEGGQLSR
ncbi:Mid1 interacting protein 1 [Chamberlinius hualienensis]